MKEWVIIPVIACATFFVIYAISEAANALATGLAKLAEKIDDLNEKVDSIVNDVADIEAVVSGRKEKFVNPF